MGSGHIHGSNRPHHRELHPKVLIFDSFCHKNRSTAWGLLFSKSDFSSFLKIDTLNLIKKMHFFGSEIKGDHDFRDFWNFSLFEFEK